jgi:hypothetical protein
MVLVGAFLVSDSPVAMALVVMGAGAAIVGIVLNVAEGPVEIGLRGVRFNLGQRVAQMAAERKLSKEETAEAVATAKELERQSHGAKVDRVINRFRPPPEDDTISQLLPRMSEAEGLLRHREPTLQDRRKAESIMDDVAEEIVENAPVMVARRVTRRKKKAR